MAAAAQAIADQISQVRELFSGANQNIAALTERIAACEQLANQAANSAHSNMARVAALEQGAATVTEVRNHGNWLSTLDGDTKNLQSRMNAIEQSANSGTGAPSRRFKDILIDRKGAVNVPKYSGDSKNFMTFKGKLKLFFSQTDKVCEGLIRWVEDQPSTATITEADARSWARSEGHSDPDYEWALEQIYGFLGAKLEGTPFTQWETCEKVGIHRGLVAWRSILTASQGNMRDRLRQLHAEVTNPERQKSLSAVPDALSTWEVKANECNTHPEYKLSQEQMKDHLVKFLPAEWERIVWATHGSSTYAQLKSFVIEQAARERSTSKPTTRTAATTFSSTASASNSTAAMDTNAINAAWEAWNTKWAQMDGGNDESQGDNGKVNSLEQLCQLMKGKGKGKDGGKGFSGVCHHCQKPGHIRRNCPILDKEMAARRQSRGQDQRNSWGKGGQGKGGGQWGGKFGRGKGGGTYGLDASDDDIPMEDDEDVTYVCGVFLSDPNLKPKTPHRVQSYYSKNSFAALQEDDEEADSESIIDIDDFDDNQSAATTPSESLLSTISSQNSAITDMSRMSEALDKLEVLLLEVLNPQTREGVDSDCAIEDIVDTNQEQLVAIIEKQMDDEWEIVEDEVASDPQTEVTEAMMGLVAARVWAQVASGLAPTTVDFQTTLSIVIRGASNCQLTLGERRAVRRVLDHSADLPVKERLCELLEISLEDTAPADDSTMHNLFMLGLEPGGDSVNSMEQEGDWEEIVAVIDSGAAESVAPATTASAVPVRESRGSRMGQRFFTADGTKLPNQGEKVIKAFTADGRPVSMRYQVADVTKPLCSVGKIADKENLVCFDSSGGVIFNKQSGQMTPFTREQGVYLLRTWVKRGESSGRDFARQG